MAELKTCPFCGAVADWTAGMGWFAVECTGCHVETEAYTEAEAAATVWNRRAPSGVAKALAQSTMGADQVWGAQRLSDPKPSGDTPAPQSTEGGGKCPGDGCNGCAGCWKVSDTQPESASGVWGIPDLDVEADNAASAEALIGELEYAVLARAQGLHGSAEKLSAAKSAIRIALGVPLVSGDSEANKEKGESS